MRTYIFILSITTVLFYSCVSRTEHDKLYSEKEEIAQDRDKLKKELEEIKYGAPILLADGKKFYAAKEFTQARQKFQLLVEKHSDKPETIEARKFLSSIDEEDLWNNAISSDDINYTEDYIFKYPKGKYISIALPRRNEVKRLNMQKAYDAALNLNTAYSLKKFLEDYPQHKCRFLPMLTHHSCAS